MVLVRWFLLALFATAAALAACAPSPASQLVLRIGYFPNLTHAQALVGMAPSNGTFQKALGNAVQLDPKIFNAGPSAIEALFAGEVDMTYVGPNPAINGYVKSKGQALRIIAGATSGGAVLVVRSGSAIATAADLAGKRIATPELGNTQDVAARFYMLSNNLVLSEKGGSVSILPTRNPDILTLFLKKEIDAAWVPEPWGARLVHEAQAQVMLDERSLWPDGKFATTVLIVSPRFQREHPDLVKKWLGAHVELTQWMHENPQEAMRIANGEIARLTGKGLAQDVLDEAWQRMDVTYEPLSSPLFLSADRAYRLGFLGKDKPDLSGIYDLKPLNEVLAEKRLDVVQ